MKISVKVALAGIMMVLAGLVGFAQDVPVADVKCGPWVTNVSDEAFNVLWTSNYRTLSYVEVAPDDGSDFDACRRQRFYQTVSGRRVIDTFHNVRVTGLEKGVKYRYRIMSKAVLNDDSAYHTDYGELVQLPVAGESAVRILDPEAETCRFTMLNDVHADDEKYRKLVKDVQPDDMDFLVLAGDMMSYINDIDAMVSHVYGPVPELVANVPTFYTRGNHETRGKYAYLFQKYNPTVSGDTYFLLRHGPVAVVVLDAGEDKPDSSKEYSEAVDFDLFRQQQLEWLKTAVEDPAFREAPVKVAVMHIPAFNSEGSWYGEKRANEMLVPVLNEAGVDIMLSGHYHKYVLAEKGRYGNDFPILANDNVSRLDFSSDGNGYEIRIYDLEGKLTRCVTDR
jgi:predicted phosphodiesterase